MFKKLCAVAIVIMIATSATMASAQCTIAAYGDPAGTISLIQPNESFFSIYVVMFVESTANAAAYKMNMDGLGTRFFVQERIYGPTGGGLHIDEGAAGTNVALGVCAIGFGGQPILVEEYVFGTFDGADGTEVSLTANTNQGEGTLPVYVTCSSTITPCDPGPALQIAMVIPTEASSFGAIKSLYN